MRVAGEREERAAPARWYQHTWVDVVIATVLSLGVLVVHPVSYVFHHPLWLDEAWVADLARAPLSRALALSSSTPIGWLMLVRLVPGGRGEQLRIVPLLFAAGTVAAAYVLAYCLPWGSRAFSRLAAVVTASVVLLAPVSAIRNDLKQYTADAFFALVLMALGSRAERRPERRALVELAVCCLVAAIFSTTAAFVAVAVFAGLLCAAIADRSTERVRSVGIVGAGLAVGLSGYFALVVVPHTSPSLRAYWNDFYLPSSFGAFSDIWHRLDTMSPALAIPALLAVPLFVVGCVMLARIGRPGLACAWPFLWLEMIAVAMARRYPFLDLRTSQFLLVVSLVPIVVGLLALAWLLMPRHRVLVLATVVVIAAAYARGAAPYIRERSLPNEDVRGAVAYVSRQRRPGDVIVVTLPSSFAFSYYSRHGTTRFVADDAVSMGFVTRVSGVRDVVYVDGLATRDTSRALRRALAVTAETPGARVWILRSHLFVDEAAAWANTFHDLGVEPESVRAGGEKVWVVPGPHEASGS